MKVFVTGASGYLGIEVVSRLVDQGHHVIGLVRGERGAALLRSKSAEAVIGNLTRSENWPEAARSADVVIHLAAQKSGNLHEQLAGTVATTDRLLQELGTNWTGRVVHASSFSVYDYRKMKNGSTLDEASPVYDPIFEAHPYAQTKLLQERLMHEYAMASSASVAILRIAGIYGRGTTWNQGMAIRMSDSIAMMFAPRAAMKLAYIDNVVEALVLAATVAPIDSAPINIVDDDLPSFRSFAKKLKSAGCTVPRAIPVPSVALRVLARVLHRTADHESSYSTRVELLSSAGLREGWLPLRYSNERAKTVLGWRPIDGIEKAAREAKAVEGDAQPNG